MNTKKANLLQVIFLASLFLIMGSLKELSAQAPEAIPFQGVARDASGAVLPSQAIGLRYSIRDLTAGGTIVFQETFATSTNSLGLFTVNLGTGTPVIGTLGAVNWGSGAKYVQVELDPAGGTTYTDMGTTQLMSVPYALYAANGGGSGGGWVYVPGIPPSPGSVYNQSDRIGIGTNNPLEKFVVGDTGLFRMLIGHIGNFNEVESGRLVFTEDAAFVGTCGFEFHHNGADNTLSIESGCTTLGDTSIVFTRTGEVRIPERVKIGENSNPSTDIHIKQSSNGTTPSAAGIRFESAVTTNNNQVWTDGTNLNISHNGNRVAFVDNLGAYNQVSDMRMKSNIMKMGSVLSSVMALNPVRYNYNYPGADKQKVFGFIAQDVQKVLPDLVSKSPGSDLLALPYAEFSVVAIKAIQEQQEVIDAQTKKIDDLELRLKALEEMIKMQKDK